MPLPILIDSQGPRYLQGQGAPIGLFEQTSYEETELDLEEKFRIIMFSDGILEVLPGENLAKKEGYLLDAGSDLKSDMLSVFDRLGVDPSQNYPDDIAMLLVDRR